MHSYKIIGFAMIFILPSVSGQIFEFPKPQRTPSGTIENARRNSKTANGATIVDGDMVSVKDKLLQRSGMGGTDYFLFENSKGRPLYRRREDDTGRDIVAFPDPNFKPGDGHYVVLKRMATRKKPPQAKFFPMYQGFYLVLGDGLHAFLSEWKKKDHMPERRGQAGQQQQQLRQPIFPKSYNIEYTEVEGGRLVKSL